MVKQSTFHGQVAHRVTSFVEVQEAVESYGDSGTDVGAYRRIRLQTAAGTDTHNFQLTEGIVFFTGLEIDVGQCVEFVHYDVYVVASDTGRGYRDAFALISTGHGTKLTAFHFAFFGVEMRGYESYTSGVAYQDDFICQVFWFHVEVKHRTIFIDDQF